MQTERRGVINVQVIEGAWQELPGLRGGFEFALGLRSLFFFSSRRRHTRYIGDWSSDVCSSDLSDDACFVRRSATGDRGFHQSHAAAGHERRENPYRNRPGPEANGRTRMARGPVPRSEERRVGKERRSWWAAGQ